MRGSGRPMVPMVVMLSVWCVFRIIYITFMLNFIPNIIVLFTAYPLTWGISTLLFLFMVKHKDWTRDVRL